MPALRQCLTAGLRCQGNHDQERGDPRRRSVNKRFKESPVFCIVYVSKISSTWAHTRAHLGNGTCKLALHDCACDSAVQRLASVLTHSYMTAQVSASAFKKLGFTLQVNAMHSRPEQRKRKWTANTSDLICALGFRHVDHVNHVSDVHSCRAFDHDAHRDPALDRLLWVHRGDNELQYVLLRSPN